MESLQLPAEAFVRLSGASETPAGPPEDSGQDGGDGDENAGNGGRGNVDLLRIRH